MELLDLNAMHYDELVTPSRGTIMAEAEEQHKSDEIELIEIPTHTGRDVIITCKTPDSLGIVPYTLRVYKNDTILCEGTFTRLPQGTSVIIPCKYEVGDLIRCEWTDKCSRVNSHQEE